MTQVKQPSVTNKVCLVLLENTNMHFRHRLKDQKLPKLQVQDFCTSWVLIGNSLRLTFRHELKSSKNSIWAKEFNPKLGDKHYSVNDAKSYEIVQLSNTTELAHSSQIERINWRRLFWYASPQVSTIPKEFIIDTSELRKTQKDDIKSPEHTRSQHLSFWQNGAQTSKNQAMINQFELPIATYDENYAQNTKKRQAGRYKWSFWRLQQTKVNVRPFWKL